MIIEWVILIAVTLGIGYIPTVLLCIREIKKTAVSYPPHPIFNLPEEELDEILYLYRVLKQRVGWIWEMNR